MGTAKRERKKANRQQRLEELQKQQRRTKVRRRGLQLAVVVPVGVLILVLVVIAVNHKSSKSSAPTTTVASATSDSVAGDTTVPGSTVAPLPCPNEDGSSIHEQKFPSVPPTCIDPTKVYVATVTTNKGEFTIDLDPGIAPATVNNFVYLARYHYFDGTKCHRVIPGFMAQCGDPTGTGSGGPGYSFADELPAQGAYKLGSVAMANSGPNTNGSQFFIVTGQDGVALSPLYSLFGQVTTGFDSTVKAMEAAGTAGGPPTSDVILEKVTIAVKPGAVATVSTIASTPTVPPTSAN